MGLTAQFVKEHKRMGGVPDHAILLLEEDDRVAHICDVCRKRFTVDRTGLTPELVSASEVFYLCYDCLEAGVGTATVRLLSRAPKTAAKAFTHLLHALNSIDQEDWGESVTRWRMARLQVEDSASDSDF